MSRLGLCPRREAEITNPRSILLCQNGARMRCCCDTVGVEAATHASLLHSTGVERRTNGSPPASTRPRPHENGSMFYVTVFQAQENDPGDSERSSLVAVSAGWRRNDRSSPHVGRSPSNRTSSRPITDCRRSNAAGRRWRRFLRPRSSDKPVSAATHRRHKVSSMGGRRTLGPSNGASMCGWWIRRAPGLSSMHSGAIWTDSGLRSTCFRGACPMWAVTETERGGSCSGRGVELIGRATPRGVVMPTDA